MQTVLHFESAALEPDTLKVVRVEGEEHISRLYSFEIDLVAEDEALDLEAILASNCSIGFERDGETLKIHGILSGFEQLGPVPYYFRYKAVLVPKLWSTTLRQQSQIFQDKSVPEIVESVLTAAGLSGSDYELRLTQSYDPKEYVVQYRETDFDFISRLMEHNGIFYFFEQQDGGERLIIGDDNVHFDEIAGSKELPFRPAAGMESVEDSAIQALTCRQQRVTKHVTLKDYNYRKPSMNMKAEHPKPDSNPPDGMYSEYGDHFRTDNDGKHLAETRAEEMLAQEKVFSGEGTCTAFRCGHLFELSECYRGDFDQEYLVVGVRHVGWQSSPGLEGLAGPGEDGTAYRNSFTAIAADVAFRPERVTPWPKMHGVMNARIDAAGDGEYAELDEEGRYRVVIPFDLSGTEGGKATRPVRMAQPYAGPGYGFHTPLHKGTEVIWACVDGDLDRPIIAGAVPNPENASPVTSSNQTQSVLRTAAQNQMVIEDQKDSERILIETPYDNSKLLLGAPNPTSGIRATTDGHGVLHAKSGIYLNAWPNGYWDTGDASSHINAGTSAAQTVGVAAAAAGAGSIGVLSAVTAGVVGGATGLLLPGIVMTAPAGISAITPSTWTAVGIAGVGILTPAAAEVVGAAQASVMSGGGVNIYTIAGGIRVVASRGDVDIDSKSDHVKIHAKQNILGNADNSIALEAQEEVEILAKKSDVTIEACDKKVEITAKEQITLKCGKASIIMKKDGTIQISGKDIATKGSGEISTKAKKNVVIKGKKVLEN